MTAPTTTPAGPSVTSSDPAPTRGANRPGLVRPRRGRMLAGVAAGLADRFGIGRTTMRVALVVSTLLPGPQIVGYLIGWVLIPDERDARR